LPRLRKFGEGEAGHLPEGLEKDATAFDTLQIRAAMAYGLTPLGADMIEFRTGSAGEAALGRVKTPQ